MYRIRIDKYRYRTANNQSYVYKICKLLII